MEILHQAAKAGDVDHVRTLLERGWSVNARDLKGWTPLHYAAVFGHVEVAELLIKYGADVNARDRKGLTPLYYAVKEGSFNVAELLLQQGADPRVKDKRGWTPIHYGAKKAKLRVDQILAGEPPPLRIVRLLLESGSDPNAQTREGLTPLHIAVRRSNVALAKLLLDAGASPNMPDKKGWTPLHYAYRYGDEELIELLLKYGANTGVRDKKGRTPPMLRNTRPILRRGAKPMSLSGILAREATYRSRKERGEIPIRGIDLFALAWTVFLFFLSLLFGVIFAYFIYDGYLELIASILFLFTLSMLPGLAQMALNTHVIIADKLIDPLLHLPVSWGNLRWALVKQAFIWGGFSPLFAFIPAAIVYLTIRKSPAVPLGLALTGIFATLLAVSLGYLIGSYVSKYTRSLLRRIVSTVVWVLILGLGYIFDLLNKFFYKAVLPLDSVLMSVIPPFCFLHLTRSALSLTVSVASLAASVWLTRFSVRRFVRAATVAEIYAPPPALSWRVSARALIPTLKELKMVARAPRMMALIITQALLPSLLLIYWILTVLRQMLTWWFEPSLSNAATMVIMMMLVSIGIFQALQGVYIMFVAEAANARTLYLLPLTRLNVALSKSLALLLMCLPFIVAASAVAAMFLNASAGLVYAAAIVGSVLLGGLILAMWAPREPSDWSRETYSQLKLIVAWLALLTPLIVLLSLPLLPLLLPMLPKLCEIVQFLFDHGHFFLLAYLVALYVGCSILAVRASREPV
ncbi:MAG: ankyrin repeat domain-containing protein [Thermofilaceae archaeon]